MPNSHLFNLRIPLQVQFHLFFIKLGFRTTLFLSRGFIIFLKGTTIFLNGGNDFQGNSLNHPCIEGKINPMIRTVLWRPLCRRWSPSRRNCGMTRHFWHVFFPMTSKLLRRYGGFLKWWVSPTNPLVFLRKLSFWGVLGVPPFKETPIWTLKNIPKTPNLRR